MRLLYHQAPTLQPDTTRLLLLLYTNGCEQCAIQALPPLTADDLISYEYRIQTCIFKHVPTRFMRIKPVW